MTHIETMIRVIDAWDSTPLPKNKDGRLWQMMEEMRQALEESLVNHIPDATKMVSGVKDSLTTQQEQGEPVTADEKLARMKSELAYMRRQQEQGEPVALKKGECWPEEVMRQWDYWRKEIANGHKGSAPRDWFEGLSELKLIDTTPQQRKPLTRAEIINAVAVTFNFNSRDYDEIIEPVAKAIEAAHGIKENT